MSTASCRDGLSPRSLGQGLRLLSYNIQTGIHTRHSRDYLTRVWQHFLPHRERQGNLRRIAALLGTFDLIGLQEIDGGSLRSSFMDQIAYLADEAGFPFRYHQLNRDLGRWAQHGNGVLSRLQPSRLSDIKLPGLPGRGAVVVELPVSDGEILGICILHLALGWRARARQLGHVGHVMQSYAYRVVMGDFNCDGRSRSLRQWMQSTGLQGLDYAHRTFPSWDPRRGLDHILVSSRLHILDAQVLPYPLSDHLPVSATVALPSGVSLAKCVCRNRTDILHVRS